MEQVILVDEQDNEVGVMEKLEAHLKGKLHRAFSVLIFNSKGEMLLQKRADSKYHSGGLWTNTCCSHPLPGESIIEAGKRKLLQEMGFVCPLSFAYKFTYKIALDNELTENEWDHVLIGYYNQAPCINKFEAQDWKYLAVEEIRKDVVLNPSAYTFWFKLILTHSELHNKLVNPVY